MKRTIYIFLIFMLTASQVFLSSCMQPLDQFDPPASGTFEVPEDWEPKEAYDADHVDIKDVSPEKMPATHMELPDPQGEQFIIPLSDGGCLYAAMESVNVNDKNSSHVYDLRTIRFKADGSVCWDRKYRDDVYIIFLDSMCVFSDGSYAISLRSTVNGSGSSDYISRLYRFSSDGTLLWKAEDEETPMGSLEYLFAAPDGAVLTVGNTDRKSLNGSYAGTKITLLRFEADGRLSKDSSIDHTGTENLRDASYAAGNGLYVLVRDNVEFFDEELNSKWEIKMRSGKEYYGIMALSDGKGALVSGHVYVGPGYVSLESTRSAYFLIDNSGNEKLIYFCREVHAYISFLEMLPDGKIIAIKSMMYDAKKQTSELVFYPGTGTDWITMDTLPGIISQFIPTKDGGVTLITYQKLSYLPRPSVASYLPADTEAVITHYDSDMHLVWRRKIDQYKNVSRGDRIVPTVDDRLLIG